MVATRSKNREGGAAFTTVNLAMNGFLSAAVELGPGSGST